MDKKKQGVDIVNDVLEECIIAYPVSSFIISLYKQYQERGSLSKKQLQGLHAKATKIKDIAPGKLATIEAIINKMPTRDKSPVPLAKEEEEFHDEIPGMIEMVLATYPEHKRVLFLQAKYQNNEPLGMTEIAELKRFVEVVKRKNSN